MFLHLFSRLFANTTSLTASPEYDPPQGRRTRLTLEQLKERFVPAFGELSGNSRLHADRREASEVSLPESKRIELLKQIHVDYGRGWI